MRGPPRLPRRPEAVTVASLLVLFTGTLDLLAATALGAASTAAPRYAVPLLAAAAVLFAIGTACFVASFLTWHLLPRSRAVAVAAAALSLVNAPLAWPFAGGALHLLAREDARHLLGPRPARPSPPSRPGAGLRADG